MEIFDLYDINRKLTGETMIRGNDVPNGRYRMVVHVIVFNKEGKMLIQQRTKDRTSNPGKWDFSVGGCVVSGETSSIAAERELYEELGLKVKLQNTLANFSISFSTGFDDYYVIDYDIDEKDINYQKEEVQAVRWADKQEIIELIQADKFINYRISLVEFLFSFKQQRYGTYTK